MIGIGLDDPNITINEKCRYDACISISKEIETIGKIAIRKIEGG